MADSAVMGMALDEIITKNRQDKRKTAKPKTKAVKTKQPSLATAADKLIVSNLAASVSQSDVKELFARVGQVKSVQLSYNSSGKSIGVATVVFNKAGDAHKAFTEYHNRPLDNKPMKIELIINPDAAPIKTLTDRLGGAKSKPAKKTSAKKVKGGAKKDVSAMDLDADMDSYMNEVVLG